MDDRGDKIISLAHELLRAGRNTLTDERPSASTHLSMSFKVICLTTIIAAAGSSAITEWALSDQRSINRYERAELNALVFYVTRLKGISERALLKSIDDKFSIGDFSDMDEQEFLTVRRYLQEQAQPTP